jgi:hypothetical protein
VLFFFFFHIIQISFPLFVSHVPSVAEGRWERGRVVSCYCGGAWALPRREKQREKARDLKNKKRDFILLSSSSIILGEGKRKREKDQN